MLSINFDVTCKINLIKYMLLKSFLKGYNGKFCMP